MKDKIFPPLSRRELEGAAIARNAAAQGMVLLHNSKGVLPLTPGKVALFGNGAARTVRGGTGSGDPFNGGLSGGGDIDVDLSPRYHINILDAFLAEGFTVLNEPQLRVYAEKYDLAKRNMSDHVMSVFMYPEERLTSASTEHSRDTDTAVYVISRNAGEGNDRSMKKQVTVDGITTEVGDYCLAEAEKENLSLLRASYPNLIIILNVGGPIAVEDLLAYKPDAILLMGQAGQEGGTSLLDVVIGRVNPSGKLTATWAMRYTDYPTADYFLTDQKSAPCPEGIYVGYRWFDTFKVEPGYPFGYGLSYTNFVIQNANAKLDGDNLLVTAEVRNTGELSGREVMQLYLSAPTGELDMPKQELAAFKKTDLIPPNASEKVMLSMPLRRLASFSEDDSAYIISAGDYAMSIGNSSRNTSPLCKIHFNQKIISEKVNFQLPLQETLTEMRGLTNHTLDPQWQSVPTLVPGALHTIDSRIAEDSVTTYTTDPAYTPLMPYESIKQVNKHHWTFDDLVAKRVSVGEFLAQLTPEQLAYFCCGTGWGVQDELNPVIGTSSESVPGAAGETTHLLEKYGVPSVVMADGPGGIRITQQFQATELATGEKKTVYHHCIAWPVGTLLAQSFDLEILEQVGRGMAADMAAFRISIVLGPGMNIQRDPLCGRNFEYFSEDPLLTGKLTAAIVRGIQSTPGCGACIKHYAANSQETNRNTIDAVVGQRALREIYLEAFKIAVQESQPLSFMTSYNLINSTPSADSRDLCTHLLRNEWNFRGFVMTDWNGGSSTPWKSMHAGNDLIMPGGATRAMNIQQAVETVLPQFDERGQVKMMELIPGAPLYSTCWNSLTLDPEGEDTVIAPIGDDHTATIENDELRVDGLPVWTSTGSMREAMRNRATFEPFKNPAKTSFATLTDDGRAIVYRGKLERTPRICLGDVQASATSVLNAILSLQLQPTNS